MFLGFLIKRMSRWRKFEKEDLLLLPDAKELPYTLGKSSVSYGVAKWGQMKLWLTYVNLLNYYVPPPTSTERKIIMLVIGASPGYSIPLINKMYPGIHEWHIYDTQMPKFEALPDGQIRKQNDRLQDKIDMARWKEMSTDRTFGTTRLYVNKSTEFSNIRWHNQFFEDQDIDKWARYNSGNPDVDIVFVSDIRRFGRGSGKSSYEIEKGILEDNWLQSRAVITIKPLVSSLKFKLPWDSTKGPSTIDLINSTSEEILNAFDIVGSGTESQSIDWVVYLDGTIMLQPYSGPSSTETRLIVSGPIRSARYSTLKYQNQLSYHNRVARVKFNFFNPFIPTTLITSKEPPYPQELLNNYDSIATMFCLGYYLRRLGVSSIYYQEMVVGLYKLAVLTFNRITNNKTTVNTRRLSAKKTYSNIVNQVTPINFEGAKSSTDLGSVSQPANVVKVDPFPTLKINKVRFTEFAKLFPKLAADKFIFPTSIRSGYSGPKPLSINVPAGIMEMIGAESVPDLPGRSLKVQIKETIPDITIDTSKHRPPYWLTNFERAKVLGVRARQISNNVTPTIEVPSGVINPLDIAKLELEAKRLPLIVARTYPDGTVEEWPVNKLALTPSEIVPMIMAKT